MAFDYSPPALAAAAGVDPWALAREVTDGRPADVRAAASAFRAAGRQAVEVGRLGGAADRTTAVSHVNNGVPVWDADASGRRTRGLLSNGGDDMEDVARATIVVADELTTTAAAVQGELATLMGQVNGVIARRNAALAQNGPALPGGDRLLIEQGFYGEALGLMRGCARRVQGHLDDYDRVLVSRSGFLADLGYEAQPAPTTTLPPGLTGPQILGTPPGAQLEGGVRPGIDIAVPAPGGGVILGTPPAPDIGQTGGVPFPSGFPGLVPDGGRVLNSGETGGQGDGEPTPPTPPPPVVKGRQGKHIPGDPNFIPGRSIITDDPDELIGAAGSGDQVGAVPVGQPGSKERIDFGHEIGKYVDPEGNETPTTVGIVHYGKDGAHIVPARPRPAGPA